MEYKHNQIRISRTAHFFSSGNPMAPTAWLLTHGYAMTAEQMMLKFQDFSQEDNLIISAEGLSYFYWEGKGQRVPLSSWMTSRHRLSEIRDYSQYLFDLYSKFEKPALKILLGFSQGGTTMWRFINEMKPDFDCFINWAGDIPEDTEYDIEYLKGKNLIYFSGDQDPYITQSRLSILKERSKNEGLNVAFNSYEGPHKVDRLVLKKWYNSFIKNKD